MDQGFSRGLIHSLEADGTAIASSTTETALAPAYTIPTRSMRDGQVIRVTLWATYTINGTPNITFNATVGGDTICTSGAVTTAAAGRVKIVFEFTVRSIGSAGTIQGSLIGHSNDTNLNFLDDNTATDELDMEDEDGLAVSITATWSASHASNSIQAHQFFIEVLGAK